MHLVVSKMAAMTLQLVHDAFNGAKVTDQRREPVTSFPEFSIAKEASSVVIIFIERLERTRENERE